LSILQTLIRIDFMLRSSFIFINNSSALDSKISLGYGNTLKH
jgi:hypothetical protein